MNFGLISVDCELISVTKGECHIYLLHDSRIASISSRIFMLKACPRAFVVYSYVGNTQREKREVRGEMGFCARRLGFNPGIGGCIQKNVAIPLSPWVACGKIFK
jgi:hypothetical protein